MIHISEQEKTALDEKAVLGKATDAQDGIVMMRRMPN
jgi:hypothetical protein